MQQAALFRRERQVGEVNVVWWFVCVNQRDLREILWFLVCRLIEYSHVNILPQIAQITQRGMQQAALFRRERQVGEVVRLMLFCGFVVLSA